MSRLLLAVLAALVTLGGLAAVVVTARLVWRVVPSGATLVGCSLLFVYFAALALRPSFWPAINLAVLTGAVGGVLLLAGGLQTPGTIAAFLTVAATIDVLSMSGGLSRMLIERHRQGTSDLLLYLTLVIPYRGRLIPIVGIGDLLVGGAAATALLRQGLHPVAVGCAFAAGLLAALAYGIWQGGTPAVPFIAVAVIVLVWRHSAQERHRPLFS